MSDTENERRRQAWDFFDALRASEKGKQGQEDAEKARREAFDEFATAERLYRVKLAERIKAIRAEGTAATTAEALAKGEAEVADLKYLMRVAEGDVAVAEQRAWRHTADRKDIQEFIQWSRIVTPLGEQREGTHG